MIEDRLSRDERIRLEALNQAVTSFAMRPAGVDVIVKTATMFEKYIREGSNDDQHRVSDS